MITDQQAEDILRNYLDHMVALYLHLHASQPIDAVRTLAHALTFTTLRRLATDRKGFVVQFLYEAELLVFDATDLNATIVSLRGANLRGVDLRGANLSADPILLGGIVTAANKSANLSGADLRGANLSEATVTQQQLDQVYSCKHAKLPSGLTCHHNQ